MFCFRGLRSLARNVSAANAVLQLDHVYERPV